MSGVFLNIDPPPPHRPASVYPPPPAFGAGEDILAGWRGGGGSIFWKTPDTALYSTYVSTLCGNVSHFLSRVDPLTEGLNGVMTSIVGLT
jgi:hypothetical protein